MKKYLLFLVLSNLLITIKILGQNHFQHTLFYNDSIGSPTADLSSVNWIQGHWRGEAFGGITEEIWSPPLGNSMMGSFKLVVENQVQFYELETITEENQTLILKLKHFHANLFGWEEKDETIDFKLVKVTPNKVFFHGFTLEKISANEINMYVVIEENGKNEEMKFNYKRYQK